ncbi:ribosomal protein L7Ae [Dictyocaulus viviparus]|uniref:Ribosomal protein L7Ae n=1 Tax=Dictyocaulus viviparus TaxID=29172 RepID=A0A0D8Y8S5_DICVI|nr:ribosomal protein L7Ae [Dictyocaulus viviparus]
MNGKNEKYVSELSAVRRKKATSVKKEILKHRQQSTAFDTNEPNDSPSFSSTQLDNLVIDLLKKLKKQADRFRNVSAAKARAKRTFVCGLHESLKHIEADNVKSTIVARNLDEEVKGLILFCRFRDACISRNIPIIHASSKRYLSRALGKFPYTNIVALFHFQSFEVC